MIECPDCHTAISTRRALRMPTHSTLICNSCGTMLRPSSETLRRMDRIVNGWGKVLAGLFAFSALILLWGPDIWRHWLTIIIIDVAVVAGYGITAFRSFQKDFQFEAVHDHE